jgi:hypothetical protein
MTAPDPDPDTTEILLDLLKRAAAAHHVYEKTELNGVYDKDWPRWYAAHMTRTLAESGYVLTRTPSA